MVCAMQQIEWSLISLKCIYMIEQEPCRHRHRPFTLPISPARPAPELPGRERELGRAPALSAVPVGERERGEVWRGEREECADRRVPLRLRGLELCSDAPAVRAP